MTTHMHVKLPPVLRREAGYRPAGPQRDALLRLADDLEAKGDAALVSHDILRAAMDAAAGDL